MSPQLWSIDHLIAAASSFGIVLEHVAMNKVNSLDKMLVVMAVPDLSNIPHSLVVWMRGVGRDVKVQVLSWMEEPLPLTPPLDTTPTDDFFKHVQKENHRAVTISVGDSNGKGTLAIDYDILFSAWARLEPGPEKSKLEATLRSSPHFTISYHAAGSEPERIQTPSSDPKQKGKGLQNSPMENQFPKPTGDDHWFLQGGGSGQPGAAGTLSASLADGTFLRGNQIQNEQMSDPKNGQLTNIIYGSPITYTQPITTTPHRPSPITDRAVGLSPKSPQNPNTNTNSPHLFPLPPTSQIQAQNQIINPTVNPETIPETQNEPTPCPQQINQATYTHYEPAGAALTGSGSEADYVEYEPEEYESEPDLNTATTQESNTDGVQIEHGLNTDTTNGDENQEGHYEEEYAAMMEQDQQQDQLHGGEEDGPQPFYFEYSTPDPSLLDLQNEFGNNQQHLQTQLDLLDPAILQQPQEETPFNLIPLQVDPTFALEQIPANPLVLALGQPSQVAIDQPLAPPDQSEILSQPQAEQQTLRRSARISVRGFNKNYSPKKTRKKRQTGELAPSDLEHLQAAILMSLQSENLVSEPLDQGRADEIDRICGMTAGGSIPSNEAGPSNQPLGIEDYGESILGELEFDSEEDRLSEDELGPEGDGH